MSFRTPKYRLRKGSGQALVQVNGERIYLGKYGTQESKQRYRRIVSEWLASGRKPTPPTIEPCIASARRATNGSPISREKTPDARALAMQESITSPWPA